MALGRMQAAIERSWYSGERPAPVLYLLRPLSWLYAGLIRLRRRLYQRGWLTTHNAGVPVIVVGNITVGGSGKSPLVSWLVTHLQTQGWRPGIVSRGYGGEADEWPQRVTPESDPRRVGDEPVMLAWLTGCPVAVAPRRIAATQPLVEQGVNIIVADDGLQHYALARNVEIAVREAGRGYGNQRLLPAGPLREPLERLRKVDLELVNGEAGDFWLQIDGVQPLNSVQPLQSLSRFAGKTVHAVAGIGNPQRFFKALSAAGIQVIEHALPDHHAFRLEDISFDDDYPVLMTAKDAIKCRAFAQADHWVALASVVLAPAAQSRIDAVIDKLEKPDS